METGEANVADRETEAARRERERERHKVLRILRAKNEKGRDRIEWNKRNGRREKGELSTTCDTIPGHH